MIRYSVLCQSDAACSCRNLYLVDIITLETGRSIYEGKHQEPAAPAGLELREEC